MNMEKSSSNIFMLAKAYRTMRSGWQGAPYFRRNGRELVSKPAISLKKGWEGYRRTIQCCFESFPLSSTQTGHRMLFTWRLGLPRALVRRKIQSTVPKRNNSEVGVGGGGVAKRKSSTLVKGFRARNCSTGQYFRRGNLIGPG